MRAFNNLCQLDLRQTEAVQCRLELDLRIGSAFTRFQTLRLQERFPEFKRENSVISYGMPTIFANECAV